MYEWWRFIFFVIHWVLLSLCILHGVLCPGGGGRLLSTKADCWLDLLINASFEQTTTRFHASHHSLEIELISWVQTDGCVQSKIKSSKICAYAPINYFILKQVKCLCNMFMLCLLFDPQSGTGVASSKRCSTLPPNTQVPQGTFKFELGLARFRRELLSLMEGRHSYLCNTSMCVRENRDTLSLGVGHLRKMIPGKKKETKTREGVGAERGEMSDEGRSRKKETQEERKKEWGGKRL